MYICMHSQYTYIHDNDNVNVNVNVHDSSPARGLEQVLLLWATIRAAIPDARRDVVSGCR